MDNNFTLLPSEKHFSFGPLALGTNENDSNAKYASEVIPLHYIPSYFKKGLHITNINHKKCVCIQFLKAKCEIYHGELILW